MRNDTDRQSPAYRLVRRPVSAAEPPELDDAQRRVVSHSGGPLLVLAGPGTGKTTVLAEAVVDRVTARGIDPSRILVLTFSRKAAQELRERITLRLHRTTTEPLALTFHSYAYALVRREFTLAGDEPPILLTGPEQLAEVRRMLRGEAADGALAWPQPLRPLLATRGFAAELSDFLLRAAERGLDGDALAALGRQARRDDWIGAGQFLTRYAARFDLAPVPAYDYAEIVRIAGQLLSRPEVRQRERLAYDVVLVDEYQDSDPAQEELLHALAGDGRELIAVGDPDQSIYAFRGADADVIERFPARFTNPDGTPAEVMALRTCRRSGQVLLDASRRVASRLPAVRGLGSFAANKDHRALVPGSQVGLGAARVVIASSERQEAAVIADALRRAHLVDHRPWSSMAVLVRSAVRQVPALQRALSGAGIPVAVAGDELPLAEDPGTRPLLRLVSAALDPVSLTEEAAAELLTGPLGGTDALGLRRLRRLLRERVPAPSPDNPSSDSPKSDSPISDNPISDSPSSDSPSSGTPESDSPISDSPISDSPISDSPISDSPISDSPISDSPISDNPKMDNPRSGDGAGADADRYADADGAGEYLGGDLLGEALVDPRRLASANWAPDDSLAAASEPLAAARRVAELLDVARREAANGTAAEVLWALWSASGLAERWQAASLGGGSRGAAADADLDAVMTLFDAAARFDARVPPGSMPLFIDSLSSQEIAGDTLAERSQAGEAVTICTAHRSKGRQWDLVIVAGVQEGTWPDVRMRGSLLGMDQLVEAIAHGVTASNDAAAVALASKLLDEERRLFYVAVTRAKQSLLVTAVGGDDTEDRPSRFLAELAGDDIEITPVAATGQRWLSLPSLTADLRRAVTDRSLPAPVRKRAGAELARLAAAGVGGADPSRWYALTEWTGTGPISEGDVRVSPSQVDKFVTCGFRWLIEAAVGASQPPVAGHLGTVIHAAAALVAEGADRADVARRIDEIWHQLDFGSVWYSGKQRVSADQMVGKFLDWQRSNSRELLAIEQRLRVRVDNVVISGQVDRLERDADGTGVVVDLKTGSSKPAAAELDRNPQLGVYQLAVMLGAFIELGVTQAGGAELVHVGKASGKQAAVQSQRALADDPDPSWALGLVKEVAAGMAGPEFTATANDRCRTCPAAGCCPVDERGQQVPP
jgi:superfamily I DNA/RNA helicase/RecB family exonuclease